MPATPSAAPPADSPPSSRDQGRILQSTVLTLPATLRPGLVKRDRLAVKNARTGTYLNISRSEMGILEEFREGATVPKVLSRRIQSGKCLPLREFYELILKAADRHILVDQTADNPPKNPPANFWLRLPAGIATALIVGAAAFFLYANLTAEFVLPAAWPDFAIGYLLVSAGVSLGYLLAAGVVRGCGAEIYNPRWNWKSPVPHFSLDLRDARMTRGRCEAIAGLARMVPLLLLQGGVLLAAPEWTFVLMLGVLWQALPLRAYPVTRFLNGITDRVPPDTCRHLIFEENRRDWTGFKGRLNAENKRFILLLSFYTGAWIAGAVFFAFVVVFSLTPDPAPEFSVPVFLLTTALALTLFVAGLGIRAWLRNWRVAHRQKRAKRLAQREAEARLSPYSESHPPPSEMLYEMLSRSIVFGEIQPEDRKLLSKKLKPHFFQKGELINTDGGDADRMYLIFRGRVEVLRELSTGREMPLATLGHSDVFGKVPLWERPSERQRVIRCLTPVIAYSLTGEAFSQTVITKESHLAIRNAVKVSFLSRIPVFREWSRERLRSFARMGSFVAAPQGTFVVRQNQHNQFFYILYDGISEMVAKGHRKTTLKIGDFFGEISILRNTWALADVRAREDSRFLVFSRNDLIQFIGQYPDIALTFEKIGSRRLGKPLFPIEEST